MKRLFLNKTPHGELMNEIYTALDAGGIVVIPSDTVYGLAVRADSQKAVEKLNAWKARPAGKATSVFVPSLDEAERYVKMNPLQKTTLSHMLPGAYTIILPSKHNLSKDLEAENGTLGIRIPQNKFISELMESYGKPITATSANIAGKGPHYSVDDLLKTLSMKKMEMIDLIVDAGVLPRNKPSTVVDMSGGDIEILRPGDHGIDTIVQSESVEETKSIAQKLILENVGTVLTKPLVFLLFGDVGAGKTQFVKGVGESFGITNIISPTFVIYYEYPIQVENSPVKLLYHYDLYRLQNLEEFDHIGLDDIFQPGIVACIEWSERGGAIQEKLTQKATVIQVHIGHTSETKRTLKISKLS